MVPTLHLLPVFQEVMGPDAMIFFQMFSFMQDFSLFHFHQRALVHFLLLVFCYLFSGVRSSGLRRSTGERDRLSTPIFLSCFCGSAGEEYTCKVGDLELIPFGKVPWRRERLHTAVFWPKEFQGLYSPWGCKESNMNE